MVTQPIFEAPQMFNYESIASLQKKASTRKSWHAVRFLRHAERRAYLMHTDAAPAVGKTFTPEQLSPCRDGGRLRPNPSFGFDALVSCRSRQLATAPRVRSILGAADGPVLTALLLPAELRKTSKSAAMCLISRAVGLKRRTKTHKDTDNFLVTVGAYPHKQPKI
jgi:hypothetical protein